MTLPQYQLATERETYLVDLHTLLVSRLGNHLSSLELTRYEGGIVLRGTCDSFHSKQMAQETVTQNSSIRIVANDITVVSHF